MERTKFLIDRASGTTVWVDVTNGIVENVYGDGKLTEKMTEEYKGKHITHLKKDFEEKMSITYTSVKPLEVVGVLQKMSLCKSNIRVIKTAMEHPNCLRSEASESLRVQQELLERLLDDVQTAVDKIEKHHGYLWPYNREHYARKDS